MPKITADGDNGNWEIEHVHRDGPSDTILITYKPKPNNRCPEIRYIQTQCSKAYDKHDNFITSDPNKIFKKGKNLLWHHDDEFYVDTNNRYYISVDTSPCFQTPFYHEEPEDHPDDITGNGTTGKAAKIKDRPSQPRADWRTGIKKVVVEFETCAVCVPTGEVLGCIKWQAVATEEDFGDITIPANADNKAEEKDPTDNFKKAVKKYLKTHVKKKQGEQNAQPRWYCPENGVDSPSEVTDENSPFGKPVPSGFRERWIDFEPRYEIGSLFTPFKPGKNVTVADVTVGHGIFYDTLNDAIAAIYDCPECSYIKFTYPFGKITPVKGVVFTTYPDITAKQIAPYIKDNDLFSLDFFQLNARVVNTDFIQDLAKAIAKYHKQANSEPKDASAVITLAGHLKSDKEKGYSIMVNGDELTAIIEAAFHSHHTTAEIRYLGRYILLRYISYTKAISSS